MNNSNFPYNPETTGNYENNHSLYSVIKTTLVPITMAIILGLGINYLKGCSNPMEAKSKIKEQPVQTRTNHSSLEHSL